jgi:hypothetical protein
MNISDLRPGDVLLYNGQSHIGRLIQWLDGTQASHVGIYLGRGMVGEALMVGNAGINSNPVTTSIQGTNGVQVKRHINPLDLSPVLEIAEAYIQQGNRYAYAEIILLAILLITKRLELEGTLLGRIAYRVLRDANEWINSTISAGKEPMICSEFVYRCYDEADPAENDRFSIEIVGANDQPRRRFFHRLHRRRRAGTAAPTPSPIESGSLLDRATRSERLIGALNAPTSIKWEQDESLDQMIQDFLTSDQDRENLSTSAPGSADPGPTDEELQIEALRFSETIATSHHRNLSLAMPESSAERANETFADFVTPGDLFRSPSLQRIGEFTP